MTAKEIARALIEAIEGSCYFYEYNNVLHTTYHKEDAKDIIEDTPDLSHLTIDGDINIEKFLATFGVIVTSEEKK